ncbi:MAG TPA: gamma-glutamylcyclotransferase family protein [Xanthomonadaceae bacterium]|nr:gamma-glutamylcyclotransferase family protein [Xanthomonadaceae bacterium]
MPLLFSYGTLQLESVQLGAFGRLLEGSRDELPGYELSMLEIEDANVVATSGRTHHPIAMRGDDAASSVVGTVFEITDDELASADRYEVPQYRRVSVELASGRKAWTYVDARADDANDASSAPSTKPHPGWS